MRIEPSEAQKPVLDCIRDYWDVHQFAPSVRDIADTLGHSTSTIHYHLDRLEAKGLIERDSNVARSIRLSQGERPTYDTSTDHTSAARPDSLPIPCPAAQPAGTPDPSSRSVPAAAAN